MGDSSAEAHEALMQFLYQVPIGLVQATLDGAALLGQRDELHRRHRAEAVADPAHQQLAADEALYLAKHMGRDRLCIAS